ncbi:hypothetical protein RHMOL_Rhmol12G0084500 [Rhododendron molle]|uniref:Uncharacterized protein n=1 Tax=Rhododendron molle TaxID=49168 RepID=A0ACC0LFP2_RHOML|nr:hypothetical protein RHMOL_Rhmol12G0084500 [Rhododendron molle]
MRKHGWQLPHHPLQVVAVAVFLALGFSYYVFFAPFVGKKLFQYIAIGLYTPLILCAFSLYIWCAAADPADSGVFKSKKYLKISDSKQHAQLKESKLVGESTSSKQDMNAATIGGEPLDGGTTNADTAEEECTNETKKHASSHHSSYFTALWVFMPCAFFYNCLSPLEESSEQQLSEDGMFYCSLCEVEVFKNSKHCRVCDKCVDNFDHHCRWLNNCIGKHNYRQFFILMTSSLLLLILQWSTGILVMVCCFLERKKFSADITSKLGSSFTVIPFSIAVAVCTILAMIATLPLAQLFFFHILLIRKGISTYDYIIALREQEQQGIGSQQSPQMSIASSLTGLSTASSFNNFQRGAWCTPPRLFFEDQFDVVPPDTGSVSSSGKKMAGEEPIKKTLGMPIKKKNPAAVKISPWTLARLNAEEVSKAASEARKKSKILRPVVRLEAPFGVQTESSFGSSSRRMVPKPTNNNRKQASKARAAESYGNGFMSEASTTLAPLQHEALSAFRTNQAMASSTAFVGSSSESSVASPDLVHPFQVSSSAFQKGIIPLSRSTSGGYEASGGEDSDRVPSRTVQRTLQRSIDWSNLRFGPDTDERVARLKDSISSSRANTMNH